MQKKKKVFVTPKLSALLKGRVHKPYFMGVSIAGGMMLRGMGTSIIFWFFLTILYDLLEFFFVSLFSSRFILRSRSVPFHPPLITWDAVAPPIQYDPYIQAAAAGLNAARVHCDDLFYVDWMSEGDPR